MVCCLDLLWWYSWNVVVQLGLRFIEAGLLQKVLDYVLAVDGIGVRLCCG